VLLLVVAALLSGASSQRLRELVSARPAAMDRSGARVEPPTARRRPRANVTAAFVLYPGSVVTPDDPAVGAGDNRRAIPARNR
jgi:hypothetical protein